MTKRQLESWAALLGFEKDETGRRVDVWMVDGLWRTMVGFEDSARGHWVSGLHMRRADALAELERFLRRESQRVVAALQKRLDS